MKFLLFSIFLNFTLIFSIPIETNRNDPMESKEIRFFLFTKNKFLIYPRTTSKPRALGNVVEKILLQELILGWEENTFNNNYYEDILFKILAYSRETLKAFIRMLTKVSWARPQNYGQMESYITWLIVTLMVLIFFN